MLRYKYGVCVITLATIAIALCLNGYGGDDDTFPQFYLQQRELYEGQPTLPQADKMEVLRKIQKEATTELNSSNSATSALFWVAQELSSSMHSGEAVRIFKKLAEMENLPHQFQHAIDLELGRALSRSGKVDEAQDVWQTLLDNENTSQLIRTIAAENMRTLAMTEQDYIAVQRIIEQELELGLGKTPLLLKSYASAARSTGDYETAHTYYQQLLDEYPDYLPENRMMYIAKALVTTAHKEDQANLGYIKDMRRVVEDYEQRALSKSDMYAEVYREYSNLAIAYTTLENAYRAKGIEMPISPVEAKERALELYQSAREGFLALPDEKKDFSTFQYLVVNVYFDPAKILWELDRIGEAHELLKTFLQEYSHFPTEYIQKAQTMMQSMNVDRENDDFEMPNMVQPLEEMEEPTNQNLSVEKLHPLNQKKISL